MKPTPPADIDHTTNATISPVERSLVERMRVALDGISLGESTSAASLQAFVSCINCLARAAPAKTSDSVATGSVDDHQEQLSAGDIHGQTLEAEPNNSPLQFKQFEIREMLGHGGFGVVFRAFDTLLGRDVALKFPRLEQLGSPHTNQRLLREAQTAAVLNHPGIVPVYETGELGSLWYIASSYIDGPTLAAWQQEQVQPIVPHAAACIVAALADAVDHAHQRGILHLDLKPANVLLERNASHGSTLPFVPRLTDFGLAGRVGLGEPAERDVVAGTLRFMSPEQVRGDRRQIGTASDIYGLGAVLYSLLAGRAPFGAGESPELAHQIQTERVRSLREARPDVAHDLDAICLKCLEKAPEHRYVSARDLADDLRRFVDDFPVEARPVGRLMRFARACRRRPALTAVCAGAVAATLIGIAFAAYHREQAALHAAVAKQVSAKADRQGREAQEWLLETSQVIHEMSSALAQEQSAFDQLASKLYAHGAQLEKDNSSPELQLASFTVGASLAALGAQQQTPLQPGNVVEPKTRHAVDLWLRVIKLWPERLAYRRALALLLLGAAQYYERAELPDFARQYRAEAASVLSPHWYEGTANDDDLADMAKQLERLATVRERLGHDETAHCLRRCAVESWRYLRAKNPSNLQFLSAWAVAQREVAADISTRGQSIERDQMLAVIETELSSNRNWEQTPAPLQLVMADLMCRRASQARTRSENDAALEFLSRAEFHLQLAEQLQPRDSESRRVERFMLREAAAVHDALGQKREAYDKLIRCRTVYEETLPERSPDDQELLRYARLCSSLGARALEYDERDEAATAFSGAANVYAKVPRLSLKDLESHAQCTTALAKIYASAGDSEKAESYFQQALDLWRRMQKRAPKSPAARAEIASIERRLSGTAKDASDSAQ